MGRRVSGARPLAYLGVWPTTPPNMNIPGVQPIYEPRDPQESDINHNLGDFWLNKTTQRLWYLAALGSHVVSGYNTRFATWLMISTGDNELEFLTGNTGGPVGPDGAKNINIIGGVGSGLVFTGTPLNNTLTLTTSGGGGVGQGLTGDAGGFVPFSAGGNINTITNNAARNSGSTVSFVGTPLSNTMTLNVTNNFNTIIGNLSGNLAPAGAIENVGLGYQVLQNFTGIAAHNIAIGNLSLQDLTTGRANTAIGQAAMTNVTSGDSNVAIGFSALSTITTGTDNVAIGNGSLSNLTLGASENTGVGDDTLNTITTGQLNTALGNNAGFSLTTSDSSNVCINHAGVAGSNSKWFFAFGDTAGNGTLFSHNYGTANTFVGENSGNLTLTGTTNTAVGFEAGLTWTTAEGATAVGHMALRNNTGAGGNDAFGSGALQNCTTGGSNTALGAVALQDATTGSFNVAVGLGALNSLTTGQFNTVIGYNAGRDFETGDDNIIIGNAAGQSLDAGDSDNIYIGNNGGGPGENNTLRLGTNGGGAGQQNRCFIAGIRGITTGVADAVAVLIDSQNQLGTVSSSIRVKENINDMGSLSEALYSLRPVTFNYKNHSSERKSVGLIAEEVAEVLPDLVVFDKDGLPETVKYHELPVLLLNELKKQHAQIIQLQYHVRELERLLLQATN